MRKRSFCRVGSATPCQFRGRIVAATHVDLARSVEEGRFRRDLYFRLNVLRISVPPLDAHREDIAQLIAHFCEKERRALSFTRAALRTLEQRAWPGNVRELRNVVDRLLCRASAAPIDEAALAEILDDRGAPAAAPSRPPLEEHVRAIVALELPSLFSATLHALVDEALARTANNKTAAAALLGVHRKVIQRVVRRRLAAAAKVRS